MTSKNKVHHIVLRSIFTRGAQARKIERPLYSTEASKIQIETTNHLLRTTVGPPSGQSVFKRKPASHLVRG
jgi:hypothetical protein